MREILFRAKAINREKGYHRTKYKNGDWVYGLITKPHNDIFPTIPMEMRNTDGINNLEVDYKTVGQFTGLTDKNGKKIFEGDIVKGYLGYGDEENDIAYIEYQEDSMGFVLVEILKEDFGKQFEMTNYVEVIGNIHDQSIEEFKNGK